MSPEGAPGRVLDATADMLDRAGFRPWWSASRGGELSHEALPPLGFGVPLGAVVGHLPLVELHEVRAVSYTHLTLPTSDLV
mgnify:CR=1 FL=1